MNIKKTILDVGCGESSKTLRFLEDFLSAENVFVVGVDWSFIFCKQSKNKARRHNLDAEYVRCDAALLPFQDAVLHIVCMLDSLRCLKGQDPKKFVKEALRKLLPQGKLYLTGLDRVSFQSRNLPAFRDPSFALSWSSYVPLNESSPFISGEPDYTETTIKERYKFVGISPEHVVSELLWRSGVEPETTWKTEIEGNYSYHYYVITAIKT